MGHRRGAIGAGRLVYAILFCGSAVYDALVDTQYISSCFIISPALLYGDYFRAYFARGVLASSWLMARYFDFAIIPGKPRESSIKMYFDLMARGRPMSASWFCGGGVAGAAMAGRDYFHFWYRDYCRLSGEAFRDYAPMPTMLAADYFVDGYRAGGDRHCFVFVYYCSRACSYLSHHLFSPMKEAPDIDGDADEFLARLSAARLALSTHSRHISRWRAALC